MANDDPNLDDDANHFQKVAKQLMKGMNATEVNKRTQASIKYFKAKNDAKFVDTGRANISYMTKGRQNATLLEPGQMFTYSYQAKHQETLEYWDRFPLILFLGMQKRGTMLGLNLHYLPPTVRAIILGKLMSVIGAKKLRHDTKMKITYGMVKGLAEYKPLQFCIKSYLPSHVQGKLVRIQPKEWHHAVFFPSELFVGASKRKVWSDARRFM